MPCSLLWKRVGSVSSEWEYYCAKLSLWTYNPDNDGHGDKVSCIAAHLMIVERGKLFLLFE
jgi:hypothetical protein